MSRFRAILADPPWSFETWQQPYAVAARAEMPYIPMTLDRIKALPVSSVAEKNCILFMWATWPKLAEAVPVVDAWGFTYRTGLPWVKMTRAAAPRVGLGYRVRSSSEVLLIGIRGNVPVPEEVKGGNGVIFEEPDALFCPIGRHSAKPDEQYARIELYPGPYLELFARRRRSGWVSIGNELDGLDIYDSLRIVAEGSTLPVMLAPQPAFAW